jgi:putative transposase
MVKLYRVADLPSETQAALADGAAAMPPKNDPSGKVNWESLAQIVPAPRQLARREGATALVPTLELAMTSAQRLARDARLVVLAAINRVMEEARCSKIAAIQTVLVGARAKSAAPELIEALRAATRRRRSPDGLPAAPTLKRWLAATDLTPLDAPRDLSLPPWADAFLAYYQKPSRPRLASAYRDFIGAIRAGEIVIADIDIPSIHKARRFLGKLNVIDKNQGRVTGSAMRALKPCVTRDWDALSSNHVWIGDGHTFKARVRHPVTGKPFQPEVTFIIDGASRRIVGWSISLSESTIAVCAAFKHAQQVTRAAPAIYYSDNGAGQTSKKIDAPITGHMARQGIEHRTGIPGNPQGRGIIERVWPTVLIPLAQKYDATCVWRGADKNHVARITQKLNRKDEGGVKVPTWPQFRDDVAEAVRAYNAEHRHRGIGGMTPDEAYAARLDPRAIVFDEGDPELDSLWMPEVIRRPERGAIRLFGNVYFRRDLVERLTEGEEVIVRYDIHDARTVWLSRMDGTYLGAADFEGNKQNAFPVADIERNLAARARGRIRLAEGKIADALDEARPLLEMRPAAAPVLSFGNVIDVNAVRIRRADAPPPGGADARQVDAPAPASISDSERYARWRTLDARARAGEPLTEDEAWWHENYPHSAHYAAESKKWAEQNAAAQPGFHQQKGVSL